MTIFLTDKQLKAQKGANTNIFYRGNPCRACLKHNPTITFSVRYMRNRRCCDCKSLRNARYYQRIKSEAAIASANA
ncbi:hypothetical protein TUM3792_41690 [Shewanella sp. MBTL60-007]|nr:hypothetical protein TUM3792_41690 [Shewanella sp. MBTL60-007]